MTTGVDSGRDAGRVRTTGGGAGDGTADGRGGAGRAPDPDTAAALARAERRAEVAEEKFRRLVDNSPAVIDVRDADDRITQANPAFLRTFGVRLADVVGYRPDADLPGADGSDIVDLLDTGRRVRESGTARVWHGRIPHPDGHLVDLHGHVFPLPTEDGGDGVGEVFVDVTALERARRELADSEQRFRALFNVAEIGVLLLAPDARVVDANPTALRLTGRTPQQVRGQPIGIALTAADVERHAPLWAELVTGRRNRYDLTVTVRGAGGRQRPARLTVTLVRTREGAPALGLGLLAPLAADTETVTVPARSMPSAGEAAVLERLAAGASLQQIASDLGMSRRGVDYRITRLRHKLRADGPGGAPANSAALIARAYALGILHPAVWPPRVAELQQPDEQSDGAG
ncbi:PAS domain S-box protein [Pseudonocardia lacus]|uniref:PAS domain S-box protein n=1 Tax=Pseudonocardia lacus TaxID=2835865 RepID=UPI001BDBBC02|nr:PAS domain S-box protein [Pseudonocardia lacus]